LVVLLLLFAVSKQCDFLCSPAQIFGQGLAAQKSGRTWKECSELLHAVQTGTPVAASVDLVQLLQENFNALLRALPRLARDNAESTRTSLVLLSGYVQFFGTALKCELVVWCGVVWCAILRCDIIALRCATLRCVTLRCAGVCSIEKPELTCFVLGRRLWHPRTSGSSPTHSFRCSTFFILNISSSLWYTN
jgi:hypothetical protein